MVSHKFSSKPLQFYSESNRQSHIFSLEIEDKYILCRNWWVTHPNTRHCEYQKEQEKKQVEMLESLYSNATDLKHGSYTYFSCCFHFWYISQSALVLNVRVGRSHYQILQGAYSTEVFQCFVNLSSPKRLGQFCTCLDFYSRYAIPCTVISTPGLSGNLHECFVTVFKNTNKLGSIKSHTRSSLFCSTSGSNLKQGPAL